MSLPPKITVLIRCRNEADYLRQVFEALRHQECDFAWEVIVVNNESADETVEISRQYGAKIVDITQSEFTYGRALNLGLSHVRSELVLILSAHSIPIGNSFLASAVTPFEDPLVAAARCIPHFSEEALVSWYQPFNVRRDDVEPPVESTFSSSVPDRRPNEVQGKIYFSNACSIIRHSLWKEMPFDEFIEASEDIAWSRAILARGYRIRHHAQVIYAYIRKREGMMAWERSERHLTARYRMGNLQVPGRREVLKRLGLLPLVSLKKGTSAMFTHMREEWRLIRFLRNLPKATQKKSVGSLREYDDNA